MSAVGCLLRRDENLHDGPPPNFSGVHPGGKRAMMEEMLIVLIVLATVTGLVLIKRRKRSGPANAAQAVYQILGAFLFVIGLILLFPAFYMVFHSGIHRQGVVFLAVSLSLIAIGHVISSRDNSR